MTPNQTNHPNNKRMLVALPEDWSRLPAPVLVSSPSPLNPSSKGSDALFGFHKHQQTYSIHRDINKI